MRVSGKSQGINKWSNGWSCSTDFQRRKSKWKKMRWIKRIQQLDSFTFSVLFAFYKREEVKIRHEPSWYDKEQLPSLTSTQIFFFDEIHVQQVCGPPVTSKVNEHNIRFPRDEEGNVYVKNGQYGTNKQPKKATFKYEQEGSFCLSVAKIESKNGNITGKRCLFFEFIGKKIVTIDAYKKEIIKEFARLRRLTPSLSQWILKNSQGMALQICR